MDEALSALVRQGVPLAKEAIIWYYVYWTIADVSLSIIGITVAYLGYKLIKRWQDHQIDLDNRNIGIGGSK
jgi:hypothetical protein